MFLRLLLLLAVFAGFVSAPFAAAMQCAGESGMGECGCCSAMEVSCCVGDPSPVQKDVPRQVVPHAGVQDWIAPARMVVRVLEVPTGNPEDKGRADEVKLPAFSIIDRICIRTI